MVNIRLWVIVVGMYVMKYHLLFPRLNTEVYLGDLMQGLYMVKVQSP